ncbi:DEAD/DEAH box helicase [Phenylobacterium sp.]|jgi:ATP-dependent RNA helicase DeaD|uniref:DEAD/DEAH box helicase n=1 Tax=Phenylobacterium sp. TaxID=1871053 RepID=UPI002F94469A
MPFPETHPALARALDAQGYREPTPVQAAVLEAPADRDLLVSAQTGSGKTVAFGLAAAGPLLGGAERFGRAAEPLGLVIAPTRELAMQVSRELAWLYAEAGVRVETCVGGMDARREQRALAAGTHLVVGTPGRLRDHLERGNLDLSALKVVVLDEADEMLDLGFREDLEEILDSTPVERRTLLFSATIAKDIATLARRYQREAVRIDTTRRDEAHGDIEYRAVRVAPNELENAVVNVLRYFESPGALVFCATRERVRHLYGALRERGFSAVALSGELSQKERENALQALRDGHARACVATDVAARGLDLPDLGLVIHADLPVNKAGLLHRSGRTGRAGRKGVSVLLVPYTKRRMAERLLEAASIEAEWSGPPSADEIRARDQVRLLEDPILNEAMSPEDLTLAQRILADRSPEQVAAALIRMHRARLPEPEEMFDDIRDRSPDTRPARAERRPAYDPARTAGGDGSWFRLAVGRSNNADPKWLIPLICRVGHVTKKDIGEIRIFDRETKFEISAEAEPKFRQAIKAAKDAGDMRVEPAGAPGPKEPRSAPRGAPKRRGPPPGKGGKPKPKRRTADG